MVHSLEVDVRRQSEEQVLKCYHDVLTANGVEKEGPGGYDWERCWKDYRFNLWRALLSVMTIGPSLESQHRKGKGIFAEKPTKADASLREMYDKINERVVAALLDHKWLEMVMEGSEVCLSCGYVPGCRTICY